MAEEDLTLRMRAVGARRAAREVDTTSKSVGRLGTSVDRTSKNAKKGRNHVGLFSRGIRGIGAVAGPAAAALGVAGLGAAVGNMISEFRESGKVSRQTQAVIKSTGGAAKLSSKDIADMSMSLSNKTGIDDEAIQTGQNMLLTFTKVRNEAGKGNDIFSQASSIMVDMGAAMHKGPGAASVMLGKALQDPVRGVTALRRVGVNLSTQQQDQIKTMAESGNVMGAQKLILRELNKEFGGSAAAQADPVDRMRVAWANLQEMLGGVLWPTITRGIGILTRFVTGIQENTGAGGKFRGMVVGVVSTLRSLWGWVSKNRAMMLQLGAAVLIGLAAFKAFMFIQTVIKWVRIALVLWKAWRAGTLAMTAAQLGLNAAFLANPIGLVIIAIVALVAGLIVAYHKVGWFRAGVDKAWSVLKSGYNWIKSNWKQIGGILLTPFKALVRFIGGLPGKIQGGFTSVVTWITNAVNDIIGVINGAIRAFNKLPGGDIGEIGTIGSNVGVAAGGAGGTQAVTGHLQHGGRVRQPGVYEVGERGRERVHLPAGAAVEPAGGWGGEITIPVTLMMPDGSVLARQVARASTRKMAAR